MKTNKKKIIITSSLIILCVGILTGVYFLTHTPDKEFIPEAVEQVDPQNTEWTENAFSPAEYSIDSKGKKEAGIRQGKEDDNTQSVLNEKGDETVINFSDSETKPESSKKKPATPPVTNDDTTNPEKQPSYEDTVPEESSATANDTPETDYSDAHAGQVYDPVFGWIETGTMEGHITDNDGDINKQVGTMD